MTIGDIRFGKCGLRANESMDFTRVENTEKYPRDNVCNPPISDPLKSEGTFGFVCCWRPALFSHPADVARTGQMKPFRGGVRDLPRSAGSGPPRFAHADHLCPGLLLRRLCRKVLFCRPALLLRIFDMRCLIRNRRRQCLCRAGTLHSST